MIAVARSSAKLSGAWVPTRDPFNFRKPYKGYTLRRPVRSTQEIRPRKIEKVKKRKKEEKKVWRRDDARVRAKQWRSEASREDER